MKTDACLTCKQIKPVSELVKDKSRKRGYQKMCKACHKIKTKEYRKRTRLANGNMYASGIEPEIRDEVMDREMPIWEKRLAIIKQCNLDIEDENDTAEIIKVLAVHGLE